MRRPTDSSRSRTSSGTLRACPASAKADEWLAITTASDATPAEVAALTSGVSEMFPHADVETADEFRQRMEGLVDQTLSIVNVMVALAVIIALIGIANTLVATIIGQLIISRHYGQHGMLPFGNLPGDPPLSLKQFVGKPGRSFCSHDPILFIGTVSFIYSFVVGYMYRNIFQGNGHFWSQG